jgi:hypothetical protein
MSSKTSVEQTNKKSDDEVRRFPGSNEFPPNEVSGWIPLYIPLELAPDTVKLVRDFAEATAFKLRDAQRKYNYYDGWKYPYWMDECREKLKEHLEKGDPRDVAAYCAFLWYHKESTVKKDNK